MPGFRSVFNRLFTTKKTLDLLDLRKDVHFPTNQLLLFPNFINESEEQSLFKQFDQKLKKLKYEQSHFDHVIEGYREMQFSSFNSENQKILDRMKQQFPSSVKWRPPHILDLNEKGSIGAHIDNPSYSGKYVSENEERKAHVLLPARTYYIMTEQVRFDYKHEIKSQNGIYEFKDKKFEQKRRITVMLRDFQQQDQ